MTFMVSAAQIAAESQAAGAGRVCFHDEAYLFAEPTEEAIAAVLPNCPTGRYKLQAIRDGRWTNLTKYSSVFGWRQLLSVLKTWDFSNPITLDPAEAIAAWRINPVQAYGALRKVFYNCIDQQAKRPAVGRIFNTLSFFAHLRPAAEGEPRYEYFMGYLQVFNEAQIQGLATVTRSREPAAVYDLVAHLTVFIQHIGQRAGDPAEAGGSCVLAQILSLLDRGAAAQRFRAIRESEHADVVEFFYWDLGALTYFGADEIDDSTLSADVDSITASIRSIHTPTASKEVAVGISMDENFFRIYAPWLYFYAQQLPDVEFNFILCAEPAKAEALTREGDDFSRSLSAFNRSGFPANVRIYSISTPDFVSDAKTFYACARFFMLPTLLVDHPQVYLMDADLYLEDNPTEFFRKLREVTFAAPTVNTQAALSPWRRVMAGNIAANRSALDSRLLTDLHSYIAHGLRQPASWMLDQNALSYAAERSTPGSFVSLNPFRRPFVAPKFMATWESNYRRQKAADRV